MSALCDSNSNRDICAAAALDPQAWLAAIIDSSDDAIVSKTLEGFVTTWNQGAERLFGYSAQEMIGQSILKIIPPERQHEEPMILQRMRCGERIDHFETIRRRKDGSLIHVSVTISPVRDNTGQIVGISKIARDITLAKQLQSELTQARDIAEQARESAEKARGEAEAANAAKDHFLSVLSHELRTPLTPALGAISFVERDESLSPAIREQISMVRRNVETQARLVDDLLDLTRIARGKMPLHFEAIDAHAVIRNVVTMFQKQIDEKALAVRVALRAEQHHVWADAGRFQQIVLNLMSNAVKFTPDEGSITWRSSNEGDQLIMEISDTGIGIEPEIIGRLFNAFEQGEQSRTRRFGGLGLGLSIVKSLIEVHKGSVWATSAGKGKGAAFTLKLPTIAVVEQDTRKPAKSSKPVLPGNYRVLLVEDHADTRQIMKAVLKSFGCTVFLAGSVKQATELAANETFDLLISDFGLPDGSGVDVIQQISQKQPIKAIALTGFGHDEDLRRSKEAGFSIHLTKPVNIDALQQAIQEAAGAGR